MSASVILFLSPCQTRDDFLGQVDVPLNQIPVSLRRKTSIVTHLFEVRWTEKAFFCCCRFCRTNIWPQSPSHPHINVNMYTLIQMPVPHHYLWFWKQSVMFIVCYCPLLFHCHTTCKVGCNGCVTVFFSPQLLQLCWCDLICWTIAYFPPQTENPNTERPFKSKNFLLHPRRSAWFT